MTIIFFQKLNNFIEICFKKQNEGIQSLGQGFYQLFG